MTVILKLHICIPSFIEIQFMVIYQRQICTPKHIIHNRQKLEPMQKSMRQTHYSHNIDKSLKQNDEQKRSGTNETYYIILFI